MPIRVRCPNEACARGLNIPDKGAGRTGKCPACGTAFQIPALGSTPPPTAPAEPDPYALADEPRAKPAPAAAPTPRQAAAATADVPDLEFEPEPILTRVERPRRSSVVHDGPAEVRFDAIGEGWTLLKARAGTWIGASLLAGMASFAVNILATLLGGVGQFLVALVINDAVVAFVFSLFFAGFQLFAGLAVYGVFAGGMYRMALNQRAGRPIGVGDVFRADASSLQMGLAMVMVMMSIYLGLPFLVVPAILLGGLLMFTMPLVVDARLSAVDAYKQSFLTLKDHWLQAALFHFVLGLVSVLGFFLCFVGAMFTLPLYPLGVACLYRGFYPSSDAKPVAVKGRRYDPEIDGEDGRVAGRAPGRFPWVLAGGLVGTLCLMVVAAGFAAYAFRSRPAASTFTRQPDVGRISQVRTGMTIPEVEALLGGPGEVVRETTIPSPTGPVRAQTVRWTSNVGGSLSQAELTFLDGKSTVGFGGPPQGGALALNANGVAGRAGFPNPTVRPNPAPALDPAAGIDEALRGLKGPRDAQLDAVRRLMSAPKLDDRRDEVAKAIAPILDSGGDDDLRVAASEALCAWSGPDQLLLLVRAISDPSPAVRRPAYRALALTKDSRAVSPLAAHLIDPQDRNLVVAALAQMGPMIKDGVAGYLKDDDAGVREAARSLLSRFNALDPDADLELSLTGLKDPRPDARRQAINNLQRVNPGKRRGEVIAALVSALGEDDAQARASAARTIARLATADDLDALASVLKLDEKEARRPAIDALGRLKDPRGLPLLARQMDVPDDRRAAAGVLRSFGPEAEEEVIRCLKAKDPQTRLEACRVLLTIGTRKSLAPLGKLVGDTPAVARAAESAYNAINGGNGRGSGSPAKSRKKGRN